MSTLCVEVNMSESLLHMQLPCPSCDEPVHVVADPDRRRSRWVCTRCITVGEAPFLIQPPAVERPRRPVAQA
jgi:hypothetical protein